MRDLIFVSLENWDEVWRRNQFVCAELSRRFPNRRILFVGRPLFVPQLASQMRSARSRAAVLRALRRRLWRVPELSNIWVFNPVKPLPNPLPGARALNESWQAAQIRGAARRAGLDNSMLWLNPHDSGYLIGHLGERGVVYDITDDWELAELDPGIAARIAALDRALCQSADLTMVCSAALYQSRREMARAISLIPNGVNVADYARIDQLDARAPGAFNANGVFQAQNTTRAKTATNGNAASGNAAQNGGDSPQNSATQNGAANDATSGDAAPNGAASGDAKTNDGVKTTTHEGAKVNGGASALLHAVWERAWPRPVFGYTGTLHRERIDLDLVVQLARAHPGGSVVLVGPQHWADDSLQKALSENPNLHAPGAVPYKRIAQVMARFDVCIVPHRCSEFVESLNPIKLWEYLAAGKPIVSTDVAGFRDFPQLVRIAPDAPEWIAQCRAALAEIGTEAGRELRDARRAEAAGHGWNARVDEMLGKWCELGLIEAQSETADAQTATRSS